MERLNDIVPDDAVKPGAGASRRKVSGRWRRYSLRGLFLLVTAAAVGCGWVMYHVRDFADQAAFIEELRARGFVITVEPIFNPGMWWYLAPEEQLVDVRYATVMAGFRESPLHRPSASWIGPKPEDLLRMQEWTEIWELTAYGQNITDETVADWRRRFPHLITLSLWDTQVTNKGLREIGGMSDLNQLTIGWDENTQLLAHQQSNITDEGLKGLAGLKHLQILGLMRYQISDQGLRVLAETQPQLTVLKVDTTGTITDSGLKELSRIQLMALSLWGTEITDAGLPVLYDWKRLHEVSLQRSKVTSRGREALEAARPEVGDADLMMEEFGLKSAAGGTSRK